MNNLVLFENPEFGKVRTVVIDGEPWFVGKDVAIAIGFKDTVNALKRHVEEEDQQIYQGGVETPPESIMRNVKIINESGLYALVFGSHTERSRKFKRWVTSEVLPSIRKTGGYGNPVQYGNELMFDKDGHVKLEFVKLLIEDSENKDRQLKEQQPKVEFHDHVLNSENLVTTTVVAKQYGWSAIKLNKILHELKVIYKQGKKWVLYQKYCGKGYASYRTWEYGANKTDERLEWTQKGRKFIYELLRDQLGVLPDHIEQNPIKSFKQVKR